MLRRTIGRDSRSFDLFNMQPAKPSQQGLSGTSILHSILAVASVGLTTAALFLPRSQLATPVIALLYLLPVLVSTTRWGLGSGITASVCSFLAFNFFFITPYYTFVVHQSQDVIVLFVFLIVAIVISQLVGRVKSSLASARAREQEVMHLYGLSSRLAGTRHPAEVGRSLADKIQDILSPSLIQVRLQITPDAPPTLLTMPEGLLPPGEPAYHIPLKTDRGLLGDIRLWMADQPVGDADRRLLQALAGQGALALERANLVEAETRAAILEESDRLKSALLSSVSHELRTPLVTIKAAASSLQDWTVAWDSPTRVELLSALEEEADRLNQLVGDLLNMSRIEAGALKLQRQWNMLIEIVDTVVAQMQHSLADYRLKIVVAEDLPLVLVDPVLLQQVFGNLLSNCLKYAPSGTAITLTTDIPERNPQQILIQIVNEGPPVPEEHLEHIFDKFHRVTAADRVPGTGLGLSICRGIVEAHGGRIWAKNVPSGFAFCLTLPLTWEDSVPHRVPIEPER